MATKKTSKKTEKKSVKKTVKKTTAPKKVVKKESFISEEVETKLEEQKKELVDTTLKSPETDIEQQTTTETSGTEQPSKSKQTIVLVVLIVILVLLGIMIFTKKKPEQPSKQEIKIEEQKPVEPVQQIQKIEEQKPAEPKYIEYQIKRGDTLTAIANKFKKKPDEIQKLNREIDFSKIKPGQIIKIPE